MDKTKGNPHLMKKINKSNILSLIYHQGTISRADISRYTKLNKATVSSLVGELKFEGFVIESGIGTSSGGRRPLLLKFNQHAGSIIGIELGVNFIYIILTDLCANVLWEEKVKTDSLTQQDILNILLSLISKAMNHAPKTKYGIIGLGIGVPGIVNVNKGQILYAPNLNWEDICLTLLIKSKFPKILTKIDNEANLAALGEKWFGAGKNYHNLTYISSGIGVGAGIIINGQLHYGADGVSGEVGHTTIEINGIKCSCGNYGCWEMYASEKAVKRRLIEENYANQFSLSPEEIGHITMDELCNLAKQNEPSVIQVLNEVGYYLGIGIANTIKYYNPEAIIIGNEISKVKKWLRRPIDQVIKRQRLIQQSRYPDIVFSKLNEKSCALGAVASILNKVLQFETPFTNTQSFFIHDKNDSNKN